MVCVFLDLMYEGDKIRIVDSALEAGRMEKENISLSFQSFFFFLGKC